MRRRQQLAGRFSTEHVLTRTGPAFAASQLRQGKRVRRAQVVGGVGLSAAKLADGDRRRKTREVPGEVPLERIDIEAMRVKNVDCAGRMHDATLLIQTLIELLGRSPISIFVSLKIGDSNRRLGIKVRLE